MASCLGSSNNKKSVVSLRDSTRSSSGPTNEQKAVHIESLLRKLYAKVDELEAVCNEEKEFHQLLKNRGRRGVPKIDHDCMNRVVTSQQRCAESAFNKLDIIKRGNRSSGRRTTVASASKEGDKELTSKSVTERGKSSPTNVISRGPPVSEVKNDYSNYGSLDRNIRKKKGLFSERNRRNTKTVGSLAGLDVVDTADLKPDEQYKYGLPTVEINSMASFGAPLLVVSSIPHQLFSINSRTHNQIPSHSALNWPLQPVPAINYDGFHQQPIFHRRSVSHDPRAANVSSNQVKNFDIPHREEPPLAISAEIGGHSSPPFNDYNPAGDIQQQITDINFNCLTMASPTDGISERSSKSSENGENVKVSFNHESSKSLSKDSFAQNDLAFTPHRLQETVKNFEMSDYYKYSTKFRVHGPSEKVPALPKIGAPKIQRMNGTSQLRADVLIATTHAGSGTIDVPTLHSTSDTVMGDHVDNFNSTAAPKLPPKLRPMNIMYKHSDASSIVQPDMQKRKHESMSNNSGNEFPVPEVAWIHVNPTIV